jgi:hypothetical protein
MIFAQSVSISNVIYLLRPNIHLSLKGILDAWYSSLDHPIPSPQIALPCDETSRVANRLANTTGL